jgi:hypothetical protein
VTIRCRNCGAEIVGCVETVAGRGWIDRRTRRERCARSLWPRTDRAGSRLWPPKGTVHEP